METKSIYDLNPDSDNVEFFIIEKNPLNNNYMVSGNFKEVIDCFAFKYKKDAEKAKKELNKRANKEFKKLDFKKFNCKK